MKTALLISLLPALYLSKCCVDTPAKHCIATVPTENKCTVCNWSKGYIDDGDGQCTDNYVQDCKLLNPNGECAECRTGMLPWGAACKASSDTTCLSFDENGECSVCAQDKAPDATGVCADVTPTIPNCKFYSSSTKCQLCVTGYYLYNNACHALDANCIQSNGPSCLVCNPGFKLELFGSANPDGRAQALDWFNYLKYGSMSAGYSVCTDLAITNCQTFKFNLKCTECNAGYFLTADEDCADASPLVDDCKTYTAASTCSECDPGFYLSSNTCVANPVSIDFCISYSTPTTCILCDNTHYLFSNACSAVTVILNCEVYVGPTSCFYCATGFYLSSNACVAVNPVRANCVSFDYLGCVACEAGFFISSGACSPITGNAIANCARYSADNVCEWCDASYFLTSNECTFGQIPNCAVFASSNVCVYCSGEHYPAVGGTSCVSSGPIPSGCEYLSGLTDCKLCSARYALSSNVCTRYAVDGCTVYSTETQCDRCGQMFYYDFDNNVCVFEATLDPLCKQYSSPTTCEFCITNFYLNAGVCTFVGPFNIITGCEVYQDQLNCLYCLNAYYPVTIGGKVKCTLFSPTGPVANCQYYSSSTACAVCLPWTYKDAAGACVDVLQVVPDCFSYDGSGTCVRCNGDYAFDSVTSSCQPVTTVEANCFKYVDLPATGCEQCNADFAVSAGACVAVTAVVVENCLVHSAFNTCSQCAENFYLDSPTSCTAVTTQKTDCKYYSADGICSQCIDTKLLHDNTCRPIALENCRFFASDFTCLSCDSTHYISGPGWCDLTGSVTNCAFLATATTCAACDSSTYLASATACTPRIGAIPNCLTYATATTCQYCETGYYLSAPATCTTVSTPVPDCDIYTDATTCFKCVTGALVTPSGTCINHCEELTVAACTRCAPGYFADATGSECTAVTTPIPNCKYYATETACKYCENTFDLELDKTCGTTASTTAPADCLYSATQICGLCAPDFYLDASKTCVAVTDLIDGCKIYESATACKICDTGYFMDYLTNLCEPLCQETCTVSNPFDEL